MSFPQIKKTVNMRHNVRVGLTDAKRRAVQYAMDERRERTGAQVIHVHEKPPAYKLWPPAEEMQARILEYFRIRGELPRIMQIPFESQWPTMAYVVKGLPPDAEMDLSDGRGRLVELKLETSDVLGLR